MAAPLPRPVKALGLVSLMTDASSEMIYPLLPSFLTGVLRAGPAFLGLVEGAAETLASILKIVAGRLSDRTRKRNPSWSRATVPRPWPVPWWPWPRAVRDGRRRTGRARPRRSR